MRDGEKVERRGSEVILYTSDTKCIVIYFNLFYTEQNSLMKSHMDYLIDINIGYFNNKS